MLLIHLDTSSRTPFYLQIFERVREKIDRGYLKPGERLPSSRELGEQLGVNRTTTYRAYEELWAQGYLESRPGSYSFVRKPNPLAGESIIPRKENIHWEERITKNTTRLFSRMEDPPDGQEKGLIDFRPLSPDPSLIPHDEYRKCLNQALREEKHNLLGYGDPMGYGPLRTFLAKRMKHHGIQAKEDEILITQGIQNALELIMKLMIQPESTILVEEPTYSAALPLFNYYTQFITGVSMDTHGVVLSELETTIKKHRPAFFYTMPNFHNPCGTTTSQEHREKLLSLAQKYEMPLLEDGFEEEMKYFGKAILPVKSMDREGWVIYLGTFSKVLFPGLRTGWVVADKALIKKLASLKKATNISGNPLDQAALEIFCRSGFYDRHIRRVHRIYRKRMHAAMKACRTHLNTNLCTYTKPMGGYTFWVETQAESKREQELLRLLLDNGVAVSPGNTFFSGKASRASFRISIAHRKEEEIEEGIQCIARALEQISRS